MSLFDRLSALWRLPDQITNLKEIIMANLDELQASTDRLGAQVRDAVVLIPDLRTKIAALQAAVDGGTVDADKLASITASIDATSDALAQALNPVVADPNVETGEATEQPETNPETTDPTSVEGAVPAGEPLPES